MAEICGKREAAGNAATSELTRERINQRVDSRREGQRSWAEKLGATGTVADFFVNPKPLAHADTLRDVLPREEHHRFQRKTSRNRYEVLIGENKMQN
ncbi:hypothetical protein TNCV_3991411 [Trichonephila clavipes]|uniref:Uncharacterized protein n=1 Tax=Trichonephila clavipes TaxID=2585209 RepID=A0A8X6VJJ1_TRICX|nr:hypothetical protein TNCV_3991411 [Trichonephila clavipes]